MNIALDAETLAHFSKDVQTIDEASEGYAWLLERELKARFGDVYVDSKKAEMRARGEAVFNLTGSITAEKGEDVIYDLTTTVALRAAACLAPNFILAVEKSGDGHGVWTTEKLVNLAASDAFVLFHSVFARPGLCEFQANLEYQHYPPGTPDNDLFLVFYTAIPPRTDDASLICVIGIPKADAHLAEAAAVVSGLKFSEDNVAQMAIDHTGQHTLPIHGPNIFALTNLKDHAVYKVGCTKELLSEDNENARRIAAEHGFNIVRPSS